MVDGGNLGDGIVFLWHHGRIEDRHGTGNEVLDPMQTPIVQYIGLDGGEFPLHFWIGCFKVPEKPVMAQQPLRQIIVIPARPFQETAGTEIGPTVQFVHHAKVPGRAVGGVGVEEGQVHGEGFFMEQSREGFG